MNVDEDEKRLELIEKEPLLWYETELPRDKVALGTKKEIESVEDFDVGEEVLVESLTPEQPKSCTPCRWVRRPKGL